MENQTQNLHIDIVRKFEEIVSKELKKFEKKSKNTEIKIIMHKILFCKYLNLFLGTFLLFVVVLFLALIFFRDECFTRGLLFIYVLTTVIYSIALLFYLHSISNESSDSVAFKWQNKTSDVSEAWCKTEYSEEQLLKAAKLAVYFRQRTSRFCLMLFSFIGTGLTILLPRNYIVNDWISPILLAISALLTVWFFIIFAPLEWRKSILFCLELEKKHTSQMDNTEAKEEK